MGLLERFLSKKGAFDICSVRHFPDFWDFEQITMYIYRVRARLTGGGGSASAIDRSVESSETIRVACL